MSLLVLILVILVCLVVEGFFSGSELVLVISDKLRLKNKADRGDMEAQLTQNLINNPPRLFSTTLIGTNFCVVTASTVLTYFIISNFGSEYSAFALLLSPVILIFGEVVPKSIYQHHANKIVTRVGALLWWTSYVMYPFVKLLSKLTNYLLGGVEKAIGFEPRITREELASILSSKEVTNSDISPKERKMIENVFNMSDAEVKGIMIPLVEVEMLPITSDVSAALQVFDLKGFSRLPIFEHRSTNIVGMVNSIDCIFAPENVPIKDIMNPVLYIPENMPLYELYETLQGKKEEVAIVVDEYGGATGLVTLEDLLEEFVGEIHDEYELGEQHFVEVSTGKYILIGRMEIEEANEELKLNIPEGEYKTVAGFLLEQFGYIPRQGEQTVVDNRRYTVRKASGRAILEIEAEICENNLETK